MFGFFGSVEVVPVSLVDGLLAFRSMKSLTIGKKAKVKLFLPDVTLPTLSVVTVAQQSVEDGSFLCSAGIQESPETVAVLTHTLAMAGIDGACRRRSPRVPAVVRILSRELHNYRAVTRDISQTGALLVCDAEVAVGAYLTLKLDLEAVGIPELVIQVRCVRCWREDDTGRIPKFLAGVVLTQQHAETHAAWNKFYEHVLEKQGASVMARTLDGGAGADSSARFRTIQAPPAPPPTTAPQPSPATAWSPSPAMAAPPGPATAWSPAPAMAPPAAQGWSPPGPAPNYPAVSEPSPAWGAFAAQAPIIQPASVPVQPGQPTAPQPPRVEPLAIEQVNLVFRTGYRPDLIPGARGPVTVPLWYQGQWTSVVITVGLVRVELSTEGCQCWCTIFEDQAKVQFLNQVLGARS